MKRITYDWDVDGVRGPRPGDVLTTRAGTRYTVVTARQVRSSVHPSRWALGVVDGWQLPSGVAVFDAAGAPRKTQHVCVLAYPLVWHKRSKVQA